MISDPHTKKYVSVGASRIPVWVYGDTSKYTIVFVHGYFVAFSDSYGDLPMKHLLKDYCIYTFDLPGFGHSKRLSVSTTELLDAVISQHLKGRRYVLWGNSYGGVVSLKYASLDPKKLDGVILSGTPYYYTWTRLLWILKLYPRRRRGNLGRLLHDFEFMVMRNLIGIKKPVLLLYSEDDNRVSINAGRKLHSILENSKLVEIKKRSHRYLLHRVDESGFLENVKGFLREASS